MPPGEVFDLWELYLKAHGKKETRRANNGDPYHIDEISGRGRGRL